MPSHPQWLPEGFSFLSGYPSEIRKRKVLMPIQVMADESGLGQGPVIYMSSLMGPAEDWAAFADEWRAFRDQSPAIQYFKMKEAVGLSGEFYRFSEAERDAKLRGFARIINRWKFKRIVIAVGNHVKIPINVPGRRKPVKLTPYWSAFWFTLGGAALTLLAEGHSEKFEIFFDDNPRETTRARKWYPFIRYAVPEETAALLPADINVRDDKDFVALQAPDMFAWMLMEYTRCSYAGISPVPFYWLWDEMPNVKRPAYSRHFLDMPNREASLDVDPEIRAEAGRIFRSIALKRKGQP